MRYLLDTNILSDMIRNPHGAAAIRQALVAPGAVCTSVLVAAELRFGAEKRRSQLLRGKVEALLGAIPVLPFETPGDRTYAEVRSALEAAGTPISGNDFLIAAHALSAGCILVTDNEREFARVPGLTVENWLR
ncbi:MAG: type II toxin-antitoxin system VapC family toxin [Caulobacter sp.]|nr:type II toxin-antitoxin system VapC family toxin [Caulobacter sp.]